jgi:SSS family solute:Na+ symporter
LITSSDIVVIIGYFVVVFLLAFVVTIKERRKKNQAADSYFLSGKSEGWFVIGASLFASNIGSEHLVGLAGSGARGDLVAAQFEILAALILIILGWIFVPFYIRSGVYTMPEFLEKRYSPAARTYLSIISIISYILTKISVTIFAGALVFEVILGIPFWTGATLVVLATGIYTVFGGLKAVIYTDLLQMFVLIGGSLALLYFGSHALMIDLPLAQGTSIFNSVKETIITAKGKVDGTNYFNLWRPFDDPDYPWTGIVFGAPILGIWYWCTDQFIVQRVLSAKNISNARKGALFGGFLKLTPILLFAIPGVLAFTLSINHPELLMNQNGVIEYDQALPSLIMSFLPVGFKGLMIAGLLAALMSSLSSVFNSCSTLITFDFYKKYYPNTSNANLVKVGQISTVILVVIGLAWIPLMRTMTESEGIFKYLQSIQAYISPPIAAVFLFGLFYKKINASGAMKALWFGFFLGTLRILVEFLTNGYETGHATWNITIGSAAHWFVSINFLHFAILMFVLSSIILFVGSRYGKTKTDEELKPVIYDPSVLKGQSGSIKMDKLLTLLLILGVVIVWLIFSPLILARI